VGSRRRRDQGISLASLGGGLICLALAACTHAAAPAAAPANHAPADDAVALCGATSDTCLGDLPLTDVAGGAYQLDQLRGPIVMAAVSTWAKPSVEELRSIAAFHGAHPEVAVFVILDDDVDRKQAAAFARDEEVAVPVVLFDDHLWRVIGIPAVLPETFYFDAHHALIGVEQGLQTPEQITANIGL
jgi:hypothetical protein